MPDGIWLLLFGIVLLGVFRLGEAWGRIEEHKEKLDEHTRNQSD